MITLCAQQHFAATTRADNLLYLGYDNNENRTFIGWGNENLSTNDYLGSISTVENINDLLQVSYIPDTAWEEYYPDENFPKLDVKRNRITVYNGQCYTIIIPDELVTEHVSKSKTFIVALGLRDQHTVDVYLSDPHNFNGYFIPTSDKLNLDHNYSYSIFDVSSSLQKRNPEDPRVSCGNYQGNCTFANCASKKAEEMFLPLIGCVPPWFTDDNRILCQNEHRSNISKVKRNDYERVMLGKFFVFIGLFDLVTLWNVFIGPESDHWECLSVTNSLTH